MAFFEILYMTKFVKCPGHYPRELYGVVPGPKVHIPRAGNILFKTPSPVLS
jgi:hypothetical protein